MKKGEGRDFSLPWDERAQVFLESSEVTFKDTIQFNLEIKEILELIVNNDLTVIDIGCGNGATLGALAKEKELRLYGCDLSDNLIHIAKKAVSCATFFQLDISDLEHENWSRVKSSEADFVIVKRTLNNLSGRAAQRAALRKICLSMKSGAKLILIEPTFEGLMKLNFLREVFSLPLINEPNFNEYSRESDILVTLEDSDMIDISRKDHSSTFYIGSRVLQPFLWPTNKVNYSHEINEYFSKLPIKGDFGIHKLFFCRKK